VVQNSVFTDPSQDWTVIMSVQMVTELDVSASPQVLV